MSKHACLQKKILASLHQTIKTNQNDASSYAMTIKLLCRSMNDRKAWGKICSSKVWTAHVINTIKELRNFFINVASKDCIQIIKYCIDQSNIRWLREGNLSLISLKDGWRSLGKCWLIRRASSPRGCRTLIRRNLYSWGFLPKKYVLNACENLRRVPGNQKPGKKWCKKQGVFLVGRETKLNLC